METIIEEQSEKMTMLVDYIMFNTPNKMPITTCDLCHLIKVEMDELEKCLPTVSLALDQKYGISLHVVPDSNMTQLITIAKCSLDADQFNKDETEEQTMLAFVMSYVFMNGGEVTEDELLEFIKDIVMEEYVMNFINEILLKPLLLKKEKKDNNIRAETIYKWGFRSELIYDKKKMLIHVAETNECNPEDFPQQFAEAFPELFTKVYELNYDGFENEGSDECSDEDEETEEEEEE